MSQKLLEKTKRKLFPETSLKDYNKIKDYNYSQKLGKKRLPYAFLLTATIKHVFSKQQDWNPSLLLSPPQISELASSFPTRPKPFRREAVSLGAKGPI